MDYRRIKQIMKDFEASNIHSLEIEEENFKIKLGKEVTNVIHSIPNTVNTQTIEEKSQEHHHDHGVKGCEIKAPLVGTYYSAPSPNDQPFVKVGDFVKGGQTVCIIEAMKVMNEIKAPHDGIIREIKVSNEDMVEFDQTIIILE